MLYRIYFPYAERMLPERRYAVGKVFLVVTREFLRVSILLLAQKKKENHTPDASMILFWSLAAKITSSCEIK